MVEVSSILFAVGIVCVFAGVASAVMIGGELQKRGMKVNWFLFRLLLVTKYLGQYQEVTLKESGRVGTLYYSYIGGMSTALVAVLVGLALRAL